MFSFKSVPVIEIVTLKSHQIVFTASQELKVGVTSRVKVQLQGQERLESVLVRVHSSRSETRGSWTYVGRWDSPMAGTPVVGANRSSRGAERVDCRFRIVSPDLPHFTALSLDLSNSGLQIQSRGPLALGSVLTLRLETHLTDWQSVSFRARVAWINREGSRQFRVGMEFVGLEEESGRLLTELQRYLKARDTALVEQLIIECNDVFLLRKTA